MCARTLIYIYLSSITLFGILFTRLGSITEPPIVALLHLSQAPRPIVRYNYNVKFTTGYEGTQFSAL